MTVLDRCCAPNCAAPSESPHRLLSISVDPLSDTSVHAGSSIGVVPVPMCAEHKRIYYHELRSGGQRLVGRMMLASLRADETLERDSPARYVVSCGSCRVHASRTFSTAAERAKWMNSHRLDHTEPPVYTTETDARRP